MNIDQRHLAVLSVLLDGRTRSSTETGAPRAVLEKMEEAGLIYSQKRNAGFHGKPRLNWSISEAGIEARLTAEHDGIVAATPREMIRRFAVEHRKDAGDFVRLKTPSAMKTAESLQRRAQIYEKFLSTDELARPQAILE